MSATKNNVDPESTRPVPPPKDARWPVGGSVTAQAEKPGEPEAIGPYRVIQAMGEGAFGLVYLAYQPFLDRQVALKVLRAGRSLGPESERGFMNEARTIAKLRHPNIVTVYEFGTTAARNTMLTYMAMEYLPGKSLNARLLEGPLSIIEAVEITEQLAKALDYAHARNIVHRDLKPANIMFSEQGQPVIVDFGLAKLREMTADNDPLDDTLASSSSGTPTYMSPEQALGRVAGPASDQYSLALIAYEMLTGRKAYDSENIGVLLRAKLEQAPPSMNSIAPHLPAAADAALKRALLLAPEDRYPKAAEFADVLGEALLPHRRASHDILITDPVQAAELRSARQTILGFMWGLVFLTLIIILFSTAIFLRGYLNYEAPFMGDGIIASTTVHDGFRDVIALWPGSPSASSGIQVGDTLRVDIADDLQRKDGDYTINGQPRSAYPVNWQPQEGDLIERTVIRNGQPVKVRYDIERLPIELILFAVQLPPGIMAFFYAIWLLRRWGAEPGVQLFTIVLLAGCFAVVAGAVVDELANLDSLSLFLFMPLLVYLVLLFPRPMPNWERLQKRMWLLFLPFPLALGEFLSGAHIFDKFNLLVYIAYSGLVIVAVILKWVRRDLFQYPPLRLLIGSFVLATLTPLLTELVAAFDDFQTIKTLWGGNGFIHMSIYLGIVAVGGTAAILLGAIGFHRVQLLLGRTIPVTTNDAEIPR